MEGQNTTGSNTFKPNKKNLLPISLIIAVILLTGVVIIVRNPWKKTVSLVKPKTITQKVVPAINPTVKVVASEGSLTLQMNNSSQKKVGQDLIISALADSRGKDIVGYDLVIEFDSDKVDFKSADSLIADFSVYKKEEKGKISLTGVKKLSANSVNIFSGQAIISLTFKPKTTGNVAISIIKEKGKEVTELIDKTTKIYYPEVNSINLEIL